MTLVEYEKLTEMFKEKVKEYDCFDFSPPLTMKLKLVDLRIV